MKTTKYMLVRKTKKGNWKPCWIDIGGRNVEAGQSPDKEDVVRQRNSISRTYPHVEYAVLEVTV